MVNVSFSEERIIIGVSLFAIKIALQTFVFSHLINYYGFWCMSMFWKNLRVAIIDQVFVERIIVKREKTKFSAVIILQKIRKKVFKFHFKIQLFRLTKVKR